MKEVGRFKTKMKKLTALVPADDARALELQAEEHGRSVAAELRRAITAALKAEGRRV